jgi:hypothetical protein
VQLPRVRARQLGDQAAPLFDGRGPHPGDSSRAGARADAVAIAANITPVTSDRTANRPGGMSIVPTTLDVHRGGMVVQKFLQPIKPEVGSIQRQ